jgi:electron transfer flavoprotein alpha subunit
MAIWIVAEQWRGKISPITYELLVLGRELADALGVPLEAVLAGSGAEEPGATLGKADSVLYIDHPLLAEPVPELQAKAIALLAEIRRPKAILVPLSNVSLGLGSLLGAELGSPVLNFCRDARVREGRLEASCVLYGGKIEATVAPQGEPAIFGIWPNARGADESHILPAHRVEKHAVPLEPSPVRFQRYIEPEAGDVDLTQQDVLVAVGRGIQQKENLELAESLAEALGGAVCGSRPVVDQGWLPLSRQIGKSGVTVKPKLYVAAGISGAPEHTEGIRGAELIVAINTDPRAPIFDIAHYGIVGDALDVLPALADEIRARRG